jgi:hypothetical protein
MLPRVLALVLGVWLTVAPDVLGYAGPAATVARLLGPVAAAAAVVAMAEVVRGVRYVEVLTGLLAVVLPWAFGDAATAALNSVATGVALCATGLVRGRVRGRYGGGWRALVADGHGPGGGRDARNARPGG